MIIGDCHKYAKWYWQFDHNLTTIDYDFNSGWNPKIIVNDKGQHDCYAIWSKGDKNYHDEPNCHKLNYTTICEFDTYRKPIGKYIVRIIGPKRNQKSTCNV